MENIHQSNSKSDTLLLCAFMFSGISALGYEIIWTKLLGLSLGSETVAVYGVLAGYFGGMCLGAYVFHKRIKSAANPALLYVYFEIIIGLYALIIPFIFSKLPWLLPIILNSIVGQNNSAAGLCISFIISGILFLPATLCLGATLPALTEARKRAVPADMHQRGMGRLYGANTLGATIGVFATIYFLLPYSGMLWGSFVLAVSNGLAALLAWQWNLTSNNEVQSLREDKKNALATKSESVPLLILLLATGFASIGFETVGLQILSQVYRNTIFTFANILGVFLVGTASGAWLYGVLIKKTKSSFSLILSLLVALLNLSAIIAAFPMVKSLHILNAIASPGGTPFLQHLFAELTLAVLVFFIPTLFMGALFSHIASRFTEEGVGRAVAVNTLGAALAPVLFALIFIEKIGYTGSFYLVVITYFVLFAFVVLMWRIKLIIAGLSFAVLIIAGLLAPKDCVLTALGGSYKIIRRYEGIMGQVMVLENKSQTYAGVNNRYLQVDRFYLMGGGDVIKEKRLAYMPLLLTPGKGRALYLGVGTGIFMSAATEFDFDTIDGVEIVPAMLKALDYFSPMNNAITAAKNVHFYCSDARRFIFSTKNRYDVIVGDLFHPTLPGSSFLLSREHFKAAKSRLRENGAFIQFVPIYQYDSRTLKTLLRTFAACFPHCHAFLGRIDIKNVLILIGYSSETGDLRIDLDALSEKMQSIKGVKSIVYNEVNLFSYYLLDSKGIRSFAGEGPINTDLHPRIMFGVPKLAYESVPAERVATLSALLERKMDLPHDMVFDTCTSDIDKLLDDTEKQGRALACFLKAEVLSSTLPAFDKRPEEAIDLYVKTYELNPLFALNLGIPFILSPNFKQYHQKIFPRLIEATPHFDWLVTDYLSYLKNELKDKQLYKEYFNKYAPSFGGADSLNAQLVRSELFKPEP